MSKLNISHFVRGRRAYTHRALAVGGEQQRTSYSSDNINGSHAQPADKRY